MVLSRSRKGLRHYSVDLETIRFPRGDMKKGVQHGKSKENLAGKTE
jgi:hypothetical protein